MNMPTQVTTPPMGWNSWSTFGCDSHEEGIRQIADALIATGLRDAGYTYVIIDDGWYHPDREANGTLRADPQRFPSGMAALGDYLHAHGLKFGLYQTPTDRTCAQRAGVYPGSTGSRGHEQLDAETFANWGVDYLKYDWCSPEGNAADQLAAFTRMRDALAATGRPIVYGINSNSCHAAKTGATIDWSTVANTWRTTENIAPTWHTGNDNDQPMGVVDIIDINAELADRAKPGRFNDPDMLQVGVPASEEHPGLSIEEARTHFGMWALLTAPLILAADVRSLSADILTMLSNATVIAINQDPLVHQARLVTRGSDSEVWVKPLANGTRAVGLLNRADHAQPVSIELDQLGLTNTASATVNQLWTGQHHTATNKLSHEVPPHGLILFHVTEQPCQL